MDMAVQFAAANAAPATASDLLNTVNYLLDNVLGLDAGNKLAGVTATRTPQDADGHVKITITVAAGPWSRDVVDLISFAVDTEKLKSDHAYVIDIQKTIEDKLKHYVSDYVGKIAENVDGAERALVVGATSALENLLAQQVVTPLSGLLAESLLDLDLPDRAAVGNILGNGFDALGDAFFKAFLPDITRSYAKMGLAEILTAVTSGIDPAWATAIHDLGNGVVGKVLDNLVDNYFAGAENPTVGIFDNVQFADQLGHVLTRLLIDFEAIDREFIDDVLGLDGSNWIETQIATVLSSGIRTFVDQQFVDALKFLGGELDIAELTDVFKDFVGSFDISTLLSNIFKEFTPTDFAELFVNIDSLPEALVAQIGEWIGSKALGETIGGALGHVALDVLTSVFGDVTLSAIGGAIFKGIGTFLGAGVGAIAGSVVFELLDYITDGWLSDIIGDIYDWIKNDSPQAFYEAIFNPATGHYEDGGYYSKDSEQELRDAVRHTRDAFKGKINQVLDFIGEPATVAGGYDSIYMVWGKKHYNESFAYYIGRNEHLRAAQSRDATFIVKDAIGGVLRRLDFSQGDSTISHAYDQWKAALDAAGTSNAGYLSSEAFVDLQDIIGVARFANAYRQDPTYFDELMAGDSPIGITVMQQYLEAEARGFNGPKVIYGTRIDADTVGSAAAGDTIFLDGTQRRAIARGGDDIVYGSAGDDVISGGTGHDVLYGNEGGDRIDGDDGDDQIYGWLGDDLLRGGGGDDFIGGDGGNDRIEGGDGADRLFGVDGDDVILGGSGNDVINGEGGDDRIAGGAGSDQFTGREGYDIADFSDLRAAVVADLALGLAISGADRDIFTAFEGLIGTAFNDRLTGDAGANRLDGGGGDDRLIGGNGDDVYFVDSARDRLVEASGGGRDAVTSSVTFRLGANVEDLTLSGSGAIAGSGNELSNVITGNDAGNRLDGRQGDDTLVGGGGDDVMIGGAGSDKMLGGAGDDTYTVDTVGDRVIEATGEGYDSVVASIGFMLPDQVEKLVLTGRARNGIGNALDNVILGSDGADILEGRGGADAIQGNAGVDRIDGGAGDDVIAGGAGRDLLTGGAGADRFVFRAGDTGSNAASADRVLDFHHDEGDRIILSPIDAIASTPGDDRFTFIASRAFSGLAGQLRYGFVGGDTVIEGDVNGDGIADVAVRLSGQVALVASDFAL